MFSVHDLELKVCDFWLRLKSSTCMVNGFEFKIWSLKFRVKGLELGLCDSGF
jgi:hypothetical protein